MKRIVAVLGMHRSGTSAMAGLLHSNGIVMGRDNEFQPKPMPENPKGFFENVRFRKLNDRILRGNEYQVKSFSPQIPELDVHPAQYATMQVLIDEYSAVYDAWGWKDPRTCLTIEWWLRAAEDAGKIDNVRLIVMMRDVDAMVRSMHARNNREEYAGQFVELSRAYYDRLPDSIDPHWDKTLTVSFEKLIEHPAHSAEMISEHVGLPITNISHIDPKLKRQ